MRSALVVLVLLHHLALVYGAFAPFYYQEPPFTEPWAFTASGVFVLFNQAWFMGALFGLAGYFTPGAVDRHGAAGFARSRLVRLGVPMLAGLFLLEPLARVGFFLMPAELTGITVPLTFAAYPALIGLGPLWFVALLLVFDLGYAGWRTVRPAATPARSGFPSVGAVAVLVAGLAAGGCLWRILIPIGQDVHVLVEALNFPTIAYLPQYLGFFVLGIAAKRFGWLAALPDRAGWWGLALAAAASLLLFPLAVSGEFGVLAFSEDTAFTGGGTWQSAAYALWDSTMAVGLGLGAVVVFRRFFGGDSAAGRFFSRHSYAVYVIHAPIIVYLAFALRGLMLPALGKFAFAAVIAVPVCFAAGYVLRRLPGMRAVL